MGKRARRSSAYPNHQRDLWKFTTGLNFIKLVGMVATRELTLKHLRSELGGARKKCSAARVALLQFMDHSFGIGAKNVAISKRIEFLYLKDKEANEKLKALQDQIELEEPKKDQHELEILKEETDRKAARSVTVSNAAGAEFLYSLFGW